MLNAPDPTLLQTFIAIVESGSFTGAAKRVHRTQSAVSMQIQRLETALGSRLLERGAQGIRLTGTGEIFYDHARRIVADYRSAMGALGQTDIDGDITVGAPDDYVLTFLPDILTSFKRSYPQVRIHVVSEPSRQLVHSLGSGSVDIAMLTEGEGAMGGTVVHHEPLVWVGSQDHDAHVRDPIPLAIFHSGDVFRRCAVSRLEETGRNATIALTSSGFVGLDAAVQAGIAIAIIFRASVRPGMRILTQREGLPPLPRVGITLQRSDNGSNELADQFSAHVVQVLHRRNADLSASAA